MALGFSLVVIAVGSILRYAYTPTSTHGFNYPTMGLILMIFGIIGAAASVIAWAVKSYQHQTGSTAVVAPPPATVIKDEGHDEVHSPTTSS